ncbi:MAG TPA: endospore germination permease [Firmicutes bacterium]|nr:endospore germination permease [Bacillota bacterium]HHT43694.1 endospore germination permease [Bacillota bacterium]
MREVVPDNQGLVLVLLFVVGNTLVFALGALAGPDLWLAFLVATAIALPMVLLVARIRSLMGGRDLAAGLEYLFGRWPSRAVALGYGVLTWRLSCYVMSDVTNFVQAVALPTTPQFVVASVLALLMLWAAKEGVEVIARFSVVMAKVVLLVLAVTFLLMLSEVDIGEFLPVMYDGPKPVIMGALQLLDFPFLEVIVLFWIFDCFQSKNSPYKVFLPGFLIAAFVLMIVACTSMAVVGARRYGFYYFPVWTAVARINVSTFLTRLEAIIGVTFAIGSFVKMAVCLLAASRCFAYALGFKDYRFLVTPLALGAIPGSQWFLSNVLEMERSATRTHRAGELALQVVLPIVLWLVAELRSRKSKKHVKKGEASGS